jgi:hypothetical protein
MPLFPPAHAKKLQDAFPFPVLPKVTHPFGNAPDTQRDAHKAERRSLLGIKIEGR